MRYYVDAHLATGGGVSFGSFTLADLLAGLKDAFTAMRNLKVYKDGEAEYGVVGWIAALEITHGPNGWHPHLHVLFFHREHLPVE
ncbi:MAG: hypothetical protein GY925_17765 [Actinomycetia bacterium]|nr:hypothetical protein [Actinomycetes bacterium]